MLGDRVESGPENCCTLPAPRSTTPTVGKKEILTKLKLTEAEHHNKFVINEGLSWQMDALKPAEQLNARTLAQFEADERAKCVAHLEQHKRDINRM